MFMNTQNRVLRSTATVAVLFAIDKVLALVRDMLIGRAFGASATLDAYYAAFELPDGLFTVVAGSALATALIPVLSARIVGEAQDREQVWRLASAVLNLVLLVVAAASVAAAFLAPQIIRAVAPGFTPELVALAVRLMRLVLVQTCISSASGIVMTSLQAHQHFLLPAVAPLAYTVGRIFGVLALAPRWGIFGLAWGGLLGAVGHLLIQVPGLLKFGARWRPAFWHPDLPQVLRLMGPRMLGLGATYLNFVLPTFLGSRLASGAISAYEYGWRLMQFPETIVGTALGIAVFPTLAEQANMRDRDGLQRTGAWALRMVLALAIPAAVGLALLGRPATALLFERGAFDAATTARVATVLRFLALGLVGHAALEVASRFYFAQRDMWRPFGAALVGLAVNAGVGSWLLFSLQEGAIALANSAGVCVQVLLLAAWVQRQPGSFDIRALTRSLGRILAASAVLAGVVLATRAILASVPLPVSTPVALAAGLGAFLGAAWLFRCEEILALLDAVRHSALH